MTSLPALDGTPETLQYVIDRLASGQIDTGGRKIRVRFGSSSFTFAAAVSIDGISVTHGLGSVPVAIVLTCAYANDGHQCAANVSSTSPPTSTVFTYGARDTSGIANSQTHTVYWVAIG